MTGRSPVLWTAAEVATATAGRLAPGAAWQATGVSIDSRTCAPGDLFVALSGPNFDGNDFAAAALDAGAAAAVVQRAPAALTTSPQLVVVDDCDAALTALGRFARARSQARVACVTGSVGKTGTKDGLAAALAASGATYATEGNLNNQWGAPLTLARLPAQTAYCVLELGMNHAGELGPLSRLARPDVAVITTIEAVHLEFFDSVAAIAEAKAEIFEGLGERGTAVLNRDNAYFAVLATIAEERGVGRILTFGAHVGADAHLVECHHDDDGSDVTAIVDGRTVRYRLNQPGRHRVINSLAVLAAVLGMGADIDAAAAALANVAIARGRGGRQRIAVAGGEYALIDDSYNASPASMRAAFDVLGAARPSGAGRRIAVLGDMLELGTEAPLLHAALARDLEANRVDQVFTAGPHMEALDAALPAHMRAGHAASAEALLPSVLAAIGPGDVVLVKGSLGSRMGLIADALVAAGTANSNVAASSGREMHDAV